MASFGEQRAVAELDTGRRGESGAAQHPRRGVVLCPEGTIEDGVVWAIAADKVFTVMRQDISVTANPFF